MTDQRGRWITYNGEIYNYPELRYELGADRFARPPTPRSFCAPTTAGAPTRSSAARDVRVRAVGRAGEELFCARDRFGIKPLYYATSATSLYFASEAKALLPFLP